MKKDYVIDHPELMAEWNYSKNDGLYDPHVLTCGSNKKPFWVCSVCHHEWPASVYNRSHLKKGCPECGKKNRSKTILAKSVKKGENDLASQRPDLLDEWDYDLNKGVATPDTIAITNRTILINWTCRQCGNKWKASVYNRTQLNTGCKKCSSKRAGERNRIHKFKPKASLIALFPDIAAEWHPSKNRPIKVEEIMPSSQFDAWWKCSVCGHSFQTPVANRTGDKHAGCPECNKYLHSSFPEQAVFYYLQKVFPDVKNKHLLPGSSRMELDIYIPKISTGIEYDGSYWHQSNSMSRAKRKYEICKESSIFLIRIKEDNQRFTQSKNDCDLCIVRKDNTDLGLEKAIIELFDFLKIPFKNTVHLSQDRDKIKNQYIKTFRDQSLLALYPSLCAEWHPEKNQITPEQIKPHSQDKVWWICPTCKQEYQASPAKRTSSTPTGCPVCAGKKIVSGINDFASRYPEIAKEWHPSLNNDLLPSLVAPNYSKKVWWLCSKCGNIFSMTPNKRVGRGQGCPLCSRNQRSKKVHQATIKKGINDLASQRPDLLKEWDYDLNKDIVSPDDITLGNSKTLINWICSTCGNKWQATVYSRAKLNSKCKVCAMKDFKEKCSKRNLSSINNLAVSFPDVAVEWHPTKNGALTPLDVTPYSNKEVWWLCKRNKDHEWPATIYNRTKNHSGCPLCRKKK